jgi:hypothetical protein
MRRLHPITRAAAVGAVGLVVASCVRPLVPGSGRVLGDDPLDPRTERDGVREPAKNAAFTRKVVHGKEAPATLLATDRSRCTVTEQRFKEVKEGDKVTCAWRSS